MPANPFGDLYKKEIVKILKDKGIGIKNVHELNVILEKMGILFHNGNIWTTTKEGIKYSICKSCSNADVFHPEIIEKICKFIKK